ncbi:MAG TPA: hypothetical protein VJ201_02875 [Candidatus Babeliales bacterium]|nr:hypothetical protein [Candidatus Babeliales bacterium]
MKKVFFAFACILAVQTHSQAACPTINGQNTDCKNNKNKSGCCPKTINKRPFCYVDGTWCTYEGPDSSCVVTEACGQRAS